MDEKRHECDKDNFDLVSSVKKQLSNVNMSALPSLLMLSGMWWTVCSLTHELVNICSSMEVKEDVFKP